jgi:WD40 repeat protein
MITADNGGIIKYWEPSMTNVQAFTAHGGQPIRGLSFAPRDTKFVSCSDDSTLRIWDWELYKVNTNCLQWLGLHLLSVNLYLVAFASYYCSNSINEMPQ